MHRCWLPLIATFAWLGLSSASIAEPTPQPMSIDRFDGMKKTTRLPNGITLGYIDMGPRDGQPVIVIHGYTDSARDWIHLVPYLDPHLRLVLVDIRGHGKSSKPECCYSRWDFAYDIRLLMDKLHIAKADVIGHSLGTFITQTLAEDWPDRIRKIVLISSSGGIRQGCAVATDTPAPPALDYRGEILKLKDPIDPDSEFMVAWWSSPTPVDAEFLRRQRVDAAHIPLRVWLAILEQGVDKRGLENGLRLLKTPSLLIWGDQDPIFGAEDRCSLREALPDAEVKIFKGLGHNPFWEQPAEVAAVINPFLLKAP